VLDGDVFEAGEHSVGCIADEEIQMAELLSDFFEHTVHVFGIRHGTPQMKRFTAASADFVRCLFSLGSRVERVDHDRGAEFGEVAGDVFAKSASRTRNEARLAGERLGRWILVCVQGGSRRRFGDPGCVSVLVRGSWRALRRRRRDVGLQSGHYIGYGSKSLAGHVKGVGQTIPLAEDCQHLAEFYRIDA